MLLTCERCGAPLDIPPGGAVRCAFCGATTRDPARPSPQAQPPNQRFAKRAGIASALVGLLVAFAVVGGVAANILSQPSATAVPPPPPPPPRPATSEAAEAAPVPQTTIWSTRAPGCLIDANGDGVSDSVGLTGDSNEATVVDGKTGQVLFRAPAVTYAEQLGCLGALGFFVVENNFQIDFFSARSPWSRTQVMARDKVNEYGTGAGCVQLRTQDGTTQCLQLPSGVAAACPNALLHRYWDNLPGLLGPTDPSTELSVGARKYDLTKRASGTPILSLRVTENGRPVWAKELPYASASDAGIAVAPGKIMLWAAHPSERNKGLVVGLDEQTGNQLYEHAVPDPSSESLELFEYNGKYVVAVSCCALRAYDPATGAEVWRLGR